MKTYIHDYDRKLEREILNLKSSQVSEHNTKLILDFYDYNYARDISKPRMVRQIGILKATTLFLGKDFEEATVQDFQRFINHLKQLNRSSDTIYTYKSTIKVFYKWVNGNRG
jgi:UDP-3-O-acyl-N-acetylglucosamine deacetylase